MNRLVYFLCVVELVAAAYRCPRDWIPYGGKCYLLPNDRQTWVNAKAKCNKFGAHLVVVESHAENDWLKSLVWTKINDNAYLGASDRFWEGKWRWDATGKPVKPLDWSRGQPDNYRHNENCLHIWVWRNFKWNDTNCGSRLHYICERKPIRYLGK